MVRNWQTGPEETRRERHARITILLEDLHMNMREGQTFTLEEIADYVGCEARAIREIEESAFKKLRQACDPDDRLITLKGYKHLLVRSEGMAQIIELWK